MKLTSQGIGVRLPPDLIKELDSRCANSNVPRSKVIVAALRAYLKVPAPTEALRNIGKLPENF